jgi:pyruvate dehydrogenase (quinone)
VAKTVSDLVVERLTEWGVKRVYGYPGDGINPLLGAFARADGGPRLLQVRHEEMAAFMACGHAKFTGQVGVCMATSGPGAIHLLNGLYDAKMDHQPVVAIVGQQPASALGGHYQQEVDPVSLYKDVAHEYVHMAQVPEQFPNLVDRAIRIALAERTVTCVIIPVNVQEAEAAGQPPHAFKMVPGTVGYVPPRVVPPDSQLRKAAEVLNAGECVAMLVGQGAAEATDEVLRVADTLGAGIAKALLGRAAVPDDAPFVTGAIGLLGTKPSWELMQGSDTLLIVGSNFPYVQFLPPWGQARCVQIDIDGKLIGMRYPTEVPLVGDSAETLRALLPLLDRKQDRSWQERIAGEVERWWRLVESRAMVDAKPVNPQRVFWELSARLPDGCIITSDSGSAANWFARDLRLRRGMMASLSGTLATMGCGVPYAVAAKFAYPDRAVIALVGDGAFQMNGMNEMLTVARYWREWADPRLVFLVLNNRDLNQVTWEMRAMEGDPKFEASQDLPDLGYADYAELAGLRGIRVDEPGQIAAAWDQALAADRPVVLEAVTDPDIPPIPPHVEWKQARALISAVLKGDPDVTGIMREGLKEKAQDFLPGNR